MAPIVLCNDLEIPSPLSDSDAGSFLSGSDASGYPAQHSFVPRQNNHLLHNKTTSRPTLLTGGKGSWLYAADSRGTWPVFDGSGGAAVSSIGRGDRRVTDAIKEQLDTGCTYAPAADYYTNPPCDLATFLIKSTGFMMGGAVFYNSGSDATEAAIKMATQYQTEAKMNPEPRRHLFIARQRSYHGATLGSLELGGHESRKKSFHPILPENTSFVSPCYPYRDLAEHESEEEYVIRLAQELEDEIQRLGSNAVAGFIMEPVVGAALGCVPALPGYLAAMKAVCRRHGVLFIVDEVMCGMGRTGFLHAWQQENVVPDIQIVGKGLAGGYGELSGLLFSPEIHAAFGEGKTAFNHGHTFQNPPVACAAALAVQRLVEQCDLLGNIRRKGELLRRELVRRLLPHRYVGDIRGSCGFLGVEFVTDKMTKAPFPSSQGVAAAIHEKGLTREYGIYVYPGSGTVDGTRGDHFIIAPAFTITDDDVESLVERIVRLVQDYFDEYDRAANADL